MIFEFNKRSAKPTTLNRAIVAIALVIILAIGNASAHAAKPWDLIIDAKFEQAQIEAGQKPVLSGTITDQKGEPVYGADVKIRFANSSVSTKTDEGGNFTYEFDSQPDGIFAASISASVADLKGLSKATIKIGSGVSTLGDLYYNSNFDNTLKNDTFKSLKQKQYQKFIEDQNKRQQKMADLIAKKTRIQEIRDIADQKKIAKINETKPGDGVYSSDKQEKYLAKTNQRVRDLTKTQMDYTKQIYEEAKYAMKKVLDNGGSLQEAKKAYLDKLATTQNDAQSIGSANNTESHSKIIKHDYSKNKKVRGLTYNKHFS